MTQQDRINRVQFTASKLLMELDDLYDSIEDHGPADADEQMAIINRVIEVLKELENL